MYTSEVVTRLAQAVEAIDKRRFAAALAPLLEVWAETRATELAALIDRVAALFTRGPVFPARANLESMRAGLAAVPDAAITVASTEARYLDHVKRALTSFGERVRYSG